MLDGDQRAMRMVYSLMFSLPGTPVLFYGEEIGMGENLAIEGRLAVRSPMQWSGDANGGFSTADASELCRPVTDTPGFAPGDGVNAESQRRRADSLLNWFERLVRRRKECPELGWGTLRAARDRRALGVRAPRGVGRHGGRGRARPRRLARDDRACRCRAAGRSSTCSGTRRLPCDGHAELALEPFDHRWFRIAP